MMGNWKSLLWGSLLAQEKKTYRPAVEISVWQGLPVAYINKSLPSLRCNKAPVSFDVAMHLKDCSEQPRLQPDVAMCLVSHQNVKAEYCMGFWKETGNLLFLPSPSCRLPVMKIHSPEVEGPPGPHEQRGGCSEMLTTVLVVCSPHTSPGLPDLSFSCLRGKETFIFFIICYFGVCFSIIFNPISFQLLHHMNCLEPTPFQAVKVIG